jgi:hypothetical protein
MRARKSTREWRCSIWQESSAQGLNNRTFASTGQRPGDGSFLPLYMFVRDRCCPSLGHVTRPPTEAAFSARAALRGLPRPPCPRPGGSAQISFSWSGRAFLARGAGQLWPRFLARLRANDDRLDRPSGHLRSDFVSVLANAELVQQLSPRQHARNVLGFIAST